MFRELKALIPNALGSCCRTFSTSVPRLEGNLNSLHTFTEEEEMLREAGASFMQLPFCNSSNRVDI